MEDYRFALASYLESTKPLLIALGRWDEKQVLSRFAESFKPDQIWILTGAEADIGWFQVSETTEEVHLDQLHLVETARNQGIGTGLIAELQDRAVASAKALALNVMRGNRAQQLYERLGFHVDGGDEEKIRMVWRRIPDNTGGEREGPVG
jgi:ribosomal protein S18 acetylase RimI-like enzyme